MEGRPLLVATLAALAVPGAATAAYAPRLSATVEPTTPGQPAALTTTVTQAATENASRTVKVQLPQGFGANLASTVQPCGAQRPCPATSLLGTASAATAFGPFGGTVNLTGLGGGGFQLAVFLSGKALGLLPVNQTLTGSVTPTPAGFLTTFDNLPNLLTTSLKLHLDGAPRTLLTTPSECGSYTIAGAFTSQQGEHATSSATVTIAGCPPSVSALRLSPRHPRAGAALRLTYRLSAPATLTLRVRRLSPGPRLLVTKDLSAAAGDGSVRLRRLRAGRYRIELGGGGAATRRVTFRVLA
jgi:hypothetical protein